ncbi:uncharacterized protein SETTUDRAFT_171776 [Exserohilum turcica Et28A]|uniref:DUF7371 domain-containing protein n=1 Tax=Exserohilum turcicum (strain 28A) TaxID=671987 RepID=R0K5C7_EXST2|nr:uncharacterized protein SETTUDRAFT_171776 [Exserohilum turcica Et28A]EOA84719.1 hypothetical protein SETTUDRAFT_171776 [Exserohilum turcica Et28A]
MFPSSAPSRSFSTSFVTLVPIANVSSSSVMLNSSTSTTTSTSTITAPSTVAQPDLPGPSSCGESGNFTIGFDDTVVDEQSTGLLVASGMNNPYHHLFYANGYTYVPDKWEPYPAISQPNVAMFMPLGGRLLPNTPFAGTMLPGELGAGPRAPVNAYWFNAYSGYFGCALNGLTPCTLRISGFRWDNVVGQEVVVAEQKVTIPACFGYVGCRLTQVVFDEGFRALSGIQFKAYTYNLNIPQVHMMDDLQMEWYNNTCSAGILRIGHS